MIKANGNDRKGRKVGQAKVGRYGRLPRSGLVHLTEIIRFVKHLGEILVNQYCGRLVSIEILVGKASPLVTLPWISVDCEGFRF